MPADASHLSGAAAPAGSVHSPSRALQERVRSSAIVRSIPFQFSNSGRHSFAISPHGFCARCSLFPALSKLRAQGMPGGRCARGLVCNGCGRAHTSIQVTPESPGIPHAMVYGLFRALSGARALWPPSPALLHANLTPASGCQDHTTSPSASGALVLKHHQRPPHPVPR